MFSPLLLGMAMVGVYYRSVNLHEWQQLQQIRNWDQHQPLSVLPSAHTLESEAYNSSLSYARSFTNLERQVAFEHIPKVAGTTMEFAVAAKQGNLSWGACRYMDYSGCPKSTATRKPFQYKGAVNFPFWHVPAAFFPLAGSPSQSAEFFVVVREPVERLLSELSYWCRIKSRDDCREKKGLNRLARLHLRAAHPDWPSSDNLKPMQVYFHQVGHYIPQWDYVMGVSPEFPVRMADHILTLDTMDTQFNQLAAAYRLPLQWPDQKLKSAPPSKIPQLRPGVLKMVHTIYARDFTLFPNVTTTTPAALSNKHASNSSDDISLVKSTLREIAPTVD